MSDHHTTKIEDFILSYVTDNAQDETLNVTRDTDFVTTRLLDSFSILDLVMTLENEYGIKFDITELASPQMKTAHSIARIISQKSKTSS
jgi:acyl carrier protein